MNTVGPEKAKPKEEYAVSASCKGCVFFPVAVSFFGPVTSVSVSIDVLRYEIKMRESWYYTVRYPDTQSI